MKKEGLQHVVSRNGGKTNVFSAKDEKELRM